MHPRPNHEKSRLLLRPAPPPHRRPVRARSRLRVPVSSRREFPGPRSCSLPAVTDYEGR
jgi:hypothetical protein